MNNLLPWHEDIWQRLMARRRAGSLPHALLLTGPDGMGKNQFADLLAQSLLCEHRNDEYLPCGVCRGCQLFAAGTHPDQRRVAPLEEGKVIGVDQIRELAHYLAHTPQYGNHKVVIVTPADRMNINSANSLLKTLEEPPSYALLVLVTAHPRRLPVTVISRCQRLSFTPPPTERAGAWLAAQIAGPTTPELWLGLADGAPLRALALADSGTLKNRESLLGLVEQVARGEVEPLAGAANSLKLGAKETLYCMYSWIGDMIRLASCADLLNVVNQDMRTRLLGLAQELTLKDLHMQLDQVGRALQLIDRPLNQQLLLENVLITWQSAFKRRS